MVANANTGVFRQDDSVCDVIERVLSCIHFEKHGECWNRRLDRFS